MSLLSLPQKHHKKPADTKPETRMKVSAKDQIQSPSHDEIEKVAYEIYVKNGCEDGHNEEHWFQAERILLRRNLKKDIKKEKAKADQYLDIEAVLTKE